jgi:hypothetical protein
MSDKCPACGGKPMQAHAFNATTRVHSEPVTVAHLCPARCERNDYELCVCCAECMAERRDCAEG